MGFVLVGAAGAQSEGNEGLGCASQMGRSPSARYAVRAAGWR